MTQTNVSSSVLQIVASFSSGLDVFKKFREARGGKRKSKKNASVGDEEVRLARSLRQGPEHIGREYQKSIHAVGEHFASGDAIAQTSLAEILIKLNAGLVTIINTFLSRKDKHNVQLDYQSLTSLSERSRVDTCRTLRQLYYRMMHLRRPLRERPSYERESAHPNSRTKSSEAARKRKTSVSSLKAAKVRGPMLARVVIADSTKPSQVAMVRPGERKKKPRSSSSSSSPRMQSSVSLALPPPPPEVIREPPARPSNPRSRTAPDVPKPTRKQSAMDFRNAAAPASKSDLRATKSTPRLHTTIHEQEPLPPVPKTGPLPAFEPRQRKPTPTYYSIESASTKLGEIPLHKWAEPYDFDAMSKRNREAEQNGWPLSGMDEARQRKKRGLGIFRMFRKNRETA